VVLHEVNSTRTKPSTIRIMGQIHYPILYNSKAIGIQTFSDDLQCRVTAPSKFSIVSNAGSRCCCKMRSCPSKTRLCSSSSLALCNAASSRAHRIALDSPNPPQFLTPPVQLNSDVLPLGSRPVQYYSTKMGTMLVPSPISACPLQWFRYVF